MSTPAKVAEHKLADAEAVALELVNFLKPLASRIEVLGSIRRKSPIVHDIDILIEPAALVDLKGIINRLLSPVLKNGDKIKAGFYKGIQIDLYVADGSTWETLRLIRTGSAAHNVKLTSTAIAKGWKLHASGLGLTDSTGKVIARSEEEIFAALGMPYVEPEARA